MAYIYTDAMYVGKLLWLVAVKGVALFQALVHESLRIRLSGLIIHWVYIVAPQLMNMHFCTSSVLLILSSVHFLFLASWGVRKLPTPVHV